ncbi:RidA family protein [Streptomyces sp. NPDC029526]|uniref:RidA family protein n=1 Tax=Streptomyces sp. NPDC029526 TaxID=3155728 RepID=UPI0033E8BA18
MTSDAVRRGRRGSPREEPSGSARAVAAGDRVPVGGTTAFRGGVPHGEGGRRARAGAAFAGARKAVGESGPGPEPVIRSRVRPAHSRATDARVRPAHSRATDAVGRAHKELYEPVRPVTPHPVVEGFVDPRVPVSVEIEACRGAVDS